MDITVHDMNGTFLKIINPFDPNLCNELLAQLPTPVTSFSGYHDFRKIVLPKFATNKVVAIGELHGYSFLIFLHMQSCL